MKFIHGRNDQRLCVKFHAVVMHLHFIWIMHLEQLQLILKFYAVQVVFSLHECFLKWIPYNFYIFYILYFILKMWPLDYESLFHSKDFMFLLHSTNENDLQVVHTFSAWLCYNRITSGGIVLSKFYSTNI